MQRLWRSVAMGGMTRLKQLSALNPGYKYLGEKDTVSKYLFRFPELEIYSRYMENTQYDHLPAWSGDLSNQQNDDRNNQPKKIFPLPQIASDMFCSLVTSKKSRLEIQVEEEELQEKLDDLLEKIKFWGAMSSAFPSFYANGSTFIRFYLTPDNSKLILEPWDTKSCWPEFDENDELESVRIRFIYNTGEIDDKKEPIWNWAQYQLFKDRDVEYTNPRFNPHKEEEPVFSPKSTFNHNLGFVQGVWIKNGLNPKGDDGKSMLKGSLGYLDDLNYFSSKESNAGYHTLYPVLLGFGVDHEDFTKMMKENEISGGSSFLTTNQQPKNADVRFLEGTNAGLQFGEIFIQRNIQILQHTLKITLSNPDVLLGYAQSAEAMKMLYRPAINEVENMQPFLKEGICELLEKIEAVSQGTEFAIPVGTIANAKKKWGDIFSPTETDKASRVTNALNATQGQMLSRKTATAYLAPDFGVRNVEEELKEIEQDMQSDMEKDIMTFKEQADIDAKNALKTNPPTAKPKPKPKGK